VALEGFEVEAERGDGGLELVGDGVEEGVLTLVAADLADQKDGVEDDAGGDQAEEDEAHDEQGDAPLVEDDPCDVEATRPPTMSTPRVMARAMAPRRRVMFMAWR